MKERILVSCVALVDRVHSLLLARRPEHKSYGGMWEFPGGKLEAGEMPDQALIRELGEELTIQVRVTDLHPLTFTSYVYPEFDMILFLYGCRTWSGTIQATEGQHLEWVTMDDLRKIALLPADRPLLANIDRFLQSWKEQ